MSSAKELESDRKKYDKRFPLIAEAKNYDSKQDSYTVDYSASCRLKKRGTKNES